MSHSLSKKFTFGSLLLFALPTVVMMVVMSMYTIVDGFFVSRFVSTNALSSINIVYPLINVTLGAAVMFAAGSNAIVARKMGQGDMAGARKSFTFMVAVNLLIGAAAAVLGNVFAVPLVRMLGASSALLDDCVIYLRWQMGFAPALMLQILFQYYFITEGRPGIGLFLTLVAGVSNAVLDYILIVPLQMGIAGAAIATVTGYMVPSVIGLTYFAFSRKTLWFVPFRVAGAELAETCLNGSSEMVTNLSSGVITFLFNLMMMRYLGEDGVAAMTIIQYSQFLLNAMFMGFAQGVSPIISFNHGSQNHAQLRQVFKTSMLFTLVSSAAIFLCAEAGGRYIVEIFAVPGSPVFTLARHGFLIFATGYLFSGLNIFTSALFTAFADGRTSALVSFVRTFVLIAVSLMILPQLIGIDGIWLAVPVAEAGAAVICCFYLRKYRYKFHYAKVVLAD